MTSIAPEPLVDGYGRVHRDLRLSITDRCNLRCTYCMPAEGLPGQPPGELLTFAEIRRVAGLLVTRFGLESVRITGGEPTVRARLAVLVRSLADLGVDLALTTNGVTLAAMAEDLARAGLGRINVSLDSLRADRFAEIARRDQLSSVLAGIDAAITAGLSPVKVNFVVMRGVNDDELVEVARYGRGRGVVVRFIEFMPLDAQGAWRREDVVSAEEIVERIDAAYPLEQAPGRGSAPAERWRYRDGAGEIGVIPSVTRAFCESCDRIRLTADGQFRTCLFAHDDHDLRGPLRSGATDEELARIVVGAVGEKWAGHQIGRVQFIRPARSMSQIGG